MHSHEPQKDSTENTTSQVKIRSRKFRIDIDEAPESRQSDSHDDTDALFYALAIASTDEYDSYNSRMHAGTTLKNMRDALNVGVPILEAHNYYRGMPLGQSVRGTLKRQPNRVVAEFFITKGLGLSGSFYSSSDAIVRAIETNAIRDVSVGIWGGEDICDICGLNITRWWLDYWAGNDYCPHIPGQEYEDDDTGEMVTCTYTIMDAELLELSLVWAGANPSAEIIEKAETLLATRDESNIHDLLPHLKHIEKRFGYRFPSPAEAHQKHSSLLNTQPQSANGIILPKTYTPEPETEPETEPALAAAAADALPEGDPTMDALQTLKARIATARQTNTNIPEDPVGAYDYQSGIIDTLQTQIQTLNAQVAEHAAEVQRLMTTQADAEKATQTALEEAQAALVSQTEAVETAETARKEAEAVVAELTKRAEEAEAERDTQAESLKELEGTATENAAVRDAWKGRGTAAAIQLHGDEYNEETWDNTFAALPIIELQRRVEEMGRDGKGEVFRREARQGP